MKNVKELVANPTMLCGVPNVELADVLQVLTGIRNEDTYITNRIAEYGATYITTMTLTELVNEGLTKLQATRVLAAVQFNKKLSAEKLTKTNMCSPQECAIYLIDYFKALNTQQEQFIVLCLDTKSRLNHLEVIFQGCLNESIAHPREVFNVAIRHKADSIIVSHNHPSGDLKPSSEDIRVTERLQLCGDTFGIKLSDHLIIGDNTFLSMKEKGYM